MGKKGTYKKISKEEFCRLTHTPHDCWIFDTISTENHPYWKSTYEGREDRYDLRNGTDVYSFKDMPQYREIWLRKHEEGKAPAGLWNTWTQYD